MSEDIFERINETLTIVENLDIMTKFKNDILTAGEFNSVVNKINEVKDYLNGPTKTVIQDTTSYILDKIENAKLSLSSKNIMLDDDPAVTIFNEPDAIKNRINGSEQTVAQHTENINDINIQLENIALSMGFINDKIDTIDDAIETSYNDAVAAAKDYTDEKVEQSYTKMKGAYDNLDNRVTTINDTTLTFDYDIKTEPDDPKKIYDNDEDLYDGEYHD